MMVKYLYRFGGGGIWNCGIEGRRQAEYKRFVFCQDLSVNWSISVDNVTSVRKQN